MMLQHPIIIDVPSFLVQIIQTHASNKREKKKKEEKKPVVSFSLSLSSLRLASLLLLFHSKLNFFQSIHSYKIKWL
jgi:hypothetical protein